MNDSYNEWMPKMGQRVLVGKTSKNQNVFRGNGKLYVQGTYGGYYDADGEWIRFDDAPEIYYVRMGSEYSNPETDPNILKTFSTIPLAKQSSKEGSFVTYGSSNETDLQQSRIKNMDTYTKYGLLAAGAIGLYLVAKKQGLADDTVTQSAPVDNLMGLKKTSNKRGRKRRMSKLSGTTEDLFIKLQDHSGDFESLIQVVNAYWDNWDEIHRDGASIEFVGFNQDSGYVYIALDNSITIASSFGQEAIYIVTDYENGDEEFYDTYKQAKKAQ